MKSSNSVPVQSLRFWPSQLQTQAAKRITPLGIAAIVGLGSGVWIIQSAIAPSVVQAYTARVSVSLNSDPGESYEALLRRAEIAARAGVQRSFDADVLTSAVVVTVVGERGGLAVPLLEVEVTRPQWRSRPDPAQWATYFSTSRSLLGYDSPSPTATGDSPQRSPAPQQQPAGVNNTTPPPNPTNAVPERTSATSASENITVIQIPADGFNPAGQ